MSFVPHHRPRRAEAAATGRSLLDQWCLAAMKTENSIAARLAEFADRLLRDRLAWRDVGREATQWLPSTAPADHAGFSEAAEDQSAWETAVRAVQKERGSSLELSEILQEVAMRPKSPPYSGDAVRLFTVHTAKGLEFEHVWVIGLAEGVFPSWQSLQARARPSELEEERRSCFVAITRTKRNLTLSCAQSYSGWATKPSRFLAEMGVAPVPEGKG